jgi:hypothetical protein
MASVKIVTHGCHRRNADLFLKTVCVSLALFNESQSELKVSPFTYGPIYCPDTLTSDKKIALVLASEKTYEKIFIQIE